MHIVIGLNAALLAVLADNMGEVGCVRLLNIHPFVPMTYHSNHQRTYGHRVRNLRYAIHIVNSFWIKLTSQPPGISGLVGAPICGALLGDNFAWWKAGVFCGVSTHSTLCTGIP